MKKITVATVKSFIKKNREALLVKSESNFSGMDDMVVYDKDAKFEKPVPTTIALDATLGICGVWFVGHSRDYCKAYEDNNYTGFRVSNACGCWLVVIAKEVTKSEPDQTIEETDRLASDINSWVEIETEDGFTDLTPIVRSKGNKKLSAFSNQNIKQGPPVKAAIENLKGLFIMRVFGQYNRDRF